MIRITKPGRLRLAVLASGRGSNFEAICQAIEEERLNAEIVLVISDKKNAPVLNKAQTRKIDFFHIAPEDYPDKAAYEQEIIKRLKEYDITLVVLAGYMRLIGKELLKAYQWKIINIHPALLPSFPGLNAQQQAIDYGVKFSGCTVHFVDDGVDSGPIIMQRVVPVLPEDSAEALAERILIEEHQVYAEALQLLAKGQIYLDGRRVIIK
ncbi:MAG: phosphoribosylglycinamide formyltransferase [Syntrophomonadaceae bacterium]|jgi:phosphoribosylglycinamide formyltransferase-1|nr:phosphoribosylglycinamide formyltransferase [Syntrophomonadaceae bacterium]